MTASIKPAPEGERLSGADLIRQAIERRSRADADLRTAILDPEAAGDVHRPQAIKPMPPGYQDGFRCSSGA